MNLSFQTFVNRPTTPTTPSLARRPTDPVTTPSPGFRSVVGTASADISFDLDYNNIRSGKRINSAGKEEFERLQVGKWIGKPLPLKLRNPLELISSSGRQELIEDYESQQDQSSSSEEGDLGEYYYYEYYEDGDEDGGTAAEQDTEDPLVAQPTTTSQERELRAFKLNFCLWLILNIPRQKEVEFRGNVEFLGSLW